MKKAVLLSIRPRWCAKIKSGEKTIEVRKTCPQIDPPFKCYIYMTHGDERAGNENYSYVRKGNGPGKVIGEFICKILTELDVDSVGVGIRVGEQFAYLNEFNHWETCLSREEVLDYAGGERIYGWHISNLVIYDKPKELREFKRWNRTEENVPCAHTKGLYPPCENCTECNLTRPPRSFCYVEELE